MELHTRDTDPDLISIASNSLILQLLTHSLVNYCTLPLTPNWAISSLLKISSWATSVRFPMMLLDGYWHCPGKTPKSREPDAAQFYFLIGYVHPFTREKQHRRGWFMNWGF